VGRSGRVRKISPPLGFDPQTVQPVASRYTDCAAPALVVLKCKRLQNERCLCLETLNINIVFLSGLWFSKWNGWDMMLCHWVISSQHSFKKQEPLNDTECCKNLKFHNFLSIKKFISNTHMHQ
jgi:hypothetical protein